MKNIVPQLREAVDARTEAQKQAGDSERIHLFVEHEKTKADNNGDSLFHQKSLMPLYTFFSPTFVTDSELKKSLVRDIVDIFAKFKVLQLDALKRTVNNDIDSFVPPSSP